MSLETKRPGFAFRFACLYLQRLEIKAFT